MAASPGKLTYQQILDSLNLIPDMVFWFDLHGGVFLANNEACDKLGYGRDELEQINLQNIDNELEKGIQPSDLRKRYQGAGGCMNSSFIKSDGTSFPVEIRASSIDFEGKEYVSAVVRDLSLRKEPDQALVEREEIFQKAFRNNPSAVYLSSLPDGRLLEVNRTFECISGYSREELVGRTVEELNFYITPEDRARLLQVLQRDGKLEGYEIFYRIKSGKEILCTVNAELAMIGGNQCLVGNITDITEYRSAQLALKASEERNRQLIENLPVGTFISTRSGKTKYVNAETLQSLGFTNKEVLEMPAGILDRIHPDEQKMGMDAMNRAFDSGEPYQIEVRIQNSQGRYVWLHFQCNVMEEFEGEPCIFGVVSDIDKRKRAEEKIRESEVKFRTMVETSPDGVTTADPEGIISYASMRTAELHGYDHPHEIIGRHSSELIAPEELHRTDQIFAEIEVKGYSRENELSLLRKDGSTFSGEMSVSSVLDDKGKIVSFIAISRDITQRKEAEQALQESEDSLKALINATTEVAFLLDREGVFITANEALARSLGRSVESLIGSKAEDASYPELVTPRKELFRQVIETGKSVRFQDHFGGSWFDNSIYPILNNEGEISRFACYSNDITDRKKAEDEVRKSEEKFSSAFFTSPLLISISSMETGKFIAVNDAIESTFGYQKEEVLGRTTLELGLYHDPEKRKELIDQLKSGSIVHRMEMKGRKKNGKLFDAEVSASMLKLDEELCLLTVVDDVSHKKQAEQDLLIYQDNLRSMAAEITSIEDQEKRKVAEYLHDNLGQSLALAKIKTGKMIGKYESESFAGELLDVEKDISDAIQFTQSVIYELSPPILYELGLLEALKWKMKDFESKHGIKTGIKCPMEISESEEDLNLVLFRSITELLNNVAKHASADYVELEIEEDPGMLKLILRDNGTGFDQKISQTDHSRESKFGLFSIRERMNNYGGRMDISSKTGEGTIISLFLPLD